MYLTLLKIRAIFIIGGRNMKKLLSNIVFGITIFICGYLLIANLLHILYLNKYDTFDPNSFPMTNIKKNINTLESNIEKINKLDNTVYTKEELDLIKTNLNTNLVNIKSNKLLSYKKAKRFYLKDLLVIDLDADWKTNENIKMLEILSKYDNSVNNYIDVYKYDFISSAYNYDIAVQEIFQSYKYNTRDFFNTNMYEPTNERIQVRVYNFAYYVIKENYFAKLVLDIGGETSE
jgi:hypothetical protein